MAAAKTKLMIVLEMAGTFVEKQRACWDHDDWERFLGGVQATGLELSDETKRNLGNILEACKHFYAPSPRKAAAAKKTAAPKKVKAKAAAKKA